MRLIEFFTAPTVVRFAKRGDSMTKQSVTKTELRPRGHFALVDPKEKK